MKIGDIIKSKDFINLDDCYYIGKVVSISEFDGTFRAKTIERVWLNKPDNKIPEFFDAPLPGKMLLDDQGDRIQILA